MLCGLVYQTQGYYSLIRLWSSRPDYSRPVSSRRLCRAGIGEENIRRGVLPQLRFISTTNGTENSDLYQDLYGHSSSEGLSSRSSCVGFTFACCSVASGSSGIVSASLSDTPAIYRTAISGRSVFSSSAPSTDSRYKAFPLAVTPLMQQSRFITRPTDRPTEGRPAMSRHPDGRVRMQSTCEREAR